MPTLILRRSGLPGALRRLWRELADLFSLTRSTWILAIVSAPLMAASLLAILVLTSPAPALAAETAPPTDPADLSRAVSQIEQLDQMRIALASTLEGRTEEPTMETMKEVCKPVGMRAQAIARENGWQVRQVAGRYRNPDHAPATAQEKEVIDLFDRHPEITGLWEPATAGQGAGVNLYRRIDVQPSCMACHGSKDSRPAFVKNNYPADRAFDFKPGDLRGMYAVFIPEVREALAEEGS
jgi:hypothetical protein